jgi:hypothetical protein
MKGGKVEDGRGKAASGGTVSKRGEWLLHQHNLSQGSQMERCGCGHRVRGPNHVKGTHHKLGRKLG